MARQSMVLVMLGRLAGKSVMEEKAALIKQVADIDAFDIEIDCDDACELVNTIARKKEFANYDQ